MVVGRRTCREQRPELEPLEPRVLLSGGAPPFDLPVRSYPLKDMSPFVGRVDWVIFTDMDHDGWADLVSCGGSRVSVLRNVGDGSFEGPVTLTMATGGTSSPVSADVDKDGWADLVSCGGRYVVVLSNARDGSFQSAVSYSGPWWDHQSISSLTCADVNNDEWQDAVCVSEASDEVVVRRNQGDGTFEEGTRKYDVGDCPQSVAASDFDHDGWTDVVTANHEGNTLSVLMNRGDGSFAPHVTYATQRGPKSVICADLDHDGWTDLVVANYYSGTVSVLRNLGDGTFAEQVTCPVGDGPKAVIASDMDNDGWPDLVTANYFDQSVSILRNQGDGTFAPQATYAVGRCLDALASADIDHDGWTDLAIANSSSNAVSVLRNEGYGVMADQGMIEVTYSPNSVTCPDVDNDGRPDLVMTRSGYPQPSSVAVLRGLGDGRFGPVTSYVMEDGAGDLVSTDVDNDGWVDIVVCSAPGIAILRNAGDGTFAVQAPHALDRSAYALTAADVNCDGWVDLIVTHSESYTLSVLLNLGDGTFGGEAIYGTGRWPSSVTSADLDNDGWVDLLVVDTYSDALFVLRNLRDGTFAEGVRHEVGGNPRWVTAADVNGDGRADVVVANSFSDTVSVLRNRGGGKLAAQVTYAVGDNPYSVICCDVDGDGRVDLVTANEAANTVSVLWNRGKGKFADQASYAVGSSPRRVVSSDFNNDGWTDLVVANYEARSLSVLWNLAGAWPAAEIADRRVFYNNSWFDDESQGRADEDAVAPDKAALLPGDKATFSNYTSYSRGINGVMVDIRRLLDGQNLDAGDFVFMVGNSGDPGTWSPAPPPVSVDVRQAGGVDGSDRVTIIWADHAIQKCWLRVEVKANPRTGLTEPDIFYFGNAIGECGGERGNATVDSNDRLAVRASPRGVADPAPIESPYDYNRDTMVDTDDWSVAWANVTSIFTSLKLITGPSAVSLPAAPRAAGESAGGADGDSLGLAPSGSKMGTGTCAADGTPLRSQSPFPSQSLPAAPSLGVIEVAAPASLPAPSAVRVSVPGRSDAAAVADEPWPRLDDPPPASADLRAGLADALAARAIAVLS